MAVKKLNATAVDSSVSQLFGMRNKIINGGFDVWQRATTFTDWSSFAYLVDRMRIGYDGSPASGRTLSQQTFTPGQTDVPEGDPKYYAQYVFPSCGTPTNYLRWDIEGVRTLAGKKATFSFWARVPSGTMTIGIAICQEFGSGGSPSGGVYPAQTNYTVTTTWQKFVYTTTMPSITGKTLGTNNDDRIWPAVWFPTNAAGTVQLANFQLEEGGTATSFEKRPYGLELMMCQRYLLVQSGGTFAYGTATGSTAAYRCRLNQTVPLRASPAISFSGGMTVAVPGIAGANLSGISTTYFQRGFVEMDVTTSATYGSSLGQTACIQGSGTFIADAEL